MNNEKLIIVVYNNTINSVLYKIDEKYKSEVKLAYMNYLMKLYSNFNFDLYRRSLEEKISIISNLQKFKWQYLNTDIKLSILLDDSAFENLKRISNKGFELAKLMLAKNLSLDDKTLLQPVISEKEAQENIEKLNIYYNQVRVFNKNLSSQYVSEGSLDLQYASGITENMSLRIGQIKYK